MVVLVGITVTLTLMAFWFGYQHSAEFSGLVREKESYGSRFGSHSECKKERTLLDFFKIDQPQCKGLRTRTYCRKLF